MALPITTTMTRDAIKATRKTTFTRSDGISHIHLKHLGQNAIRILTSLFTTIKHNTIPNIWKTAKIIAILKPKKTPTEPASYRPITPLKPIQNIQETGSEQHHTTPYAVAILTWLQTPTYYNYSIIKHHTNLTRVPKPQ